MSAERLLDAKQRSGRAPLWLKAAEQGVQSGCVTRSCGLCVRRYDKPRAPLAAENRTKSKTGDGFARREVQGAGARSAMRGSSTWHNTDGRIDSLVAASRSDGPVSAHAFMSNPGPTLPLEQSTGAPSAVCLRLGMWVHVYCACRKSCRLPNRFMPFWHSFGRVLRELAALLVFCVTMERDQHIDPSYLPNLNGHGMAKNLYSFLLYT